MKLILLFFWIIYSLCDGKRDGYFYHYRNTSSEIKGENIHWIYFCQRLILGICICYLHSLYFPIINTIIFSISLILVFSFFHNGMYYLIRKKLNSRMIYAKGWWASSTSSEATFELNAIARTILFLTGIIGIIASFEINI